jgi:hypothetical protein
MMALPIPMRTASSDGNATLIEGFALDGIVQG